MSNVLESILDKDNLNKAYTKVVSNKGASGVDGVSVYELKEYLDNNWETIENQIRTRTYKPSPVLRVEIPKANGGVRKLGIPTVVDRMIQQAITQVLSQIVEPTFSEYSYGFRPKRSCEMAILKVLDTLNDGYDWIVDIDLENFFDKVPQDKLMSYVHEIINDGDTESLIRKYLVSGVMVNGVKQETKVGTPQGGNLSPLLSNILLDKLDKELEARGLNFARYADDCLILVKSESSAKRVMHSITKWIERKLGLAVNMSKTKITRPNKLKFLGFGFYYNPQQKRFKARVHEDSIKSFKRKLKQWTIRKRSINFRYRIKKLNEVIRGWINYYLVADMKTALIEIDAHLRTRLRVILWKEWKVPSKRQWALQKLGINKGRARQTSYMGDHYQWVVTKTCVVKAISKEKLIQAGLVIGCDYYLTRRQLKFN